VEIYRVFHHKNGYYEARDMNGEFVLSADTESEAWNELEKQENDLD
jgi:hypothetical protein